MAMMMMSVHRDGLNLIFLIIQKEMMAEVTFLKAIMLYCQNVLSFRLGGRTVNNSGRTSGEGRFVRFSHPNGNRPALKMILSLQVLIWQ